MSTYRGFSFPFRRGPKGFPVGAEDDELIAQAVTQLVLTRKRDRLMRPRLGTKTSQYLFEDNAPEAVQLVVADLQATIGAFEPRVIVQRIQVAQVNPDANNVLGGMNVQIAFVSRITQRPGIVSVTLLPS